MITRFSFITFILALTLGLSLTDSEKIKNLFHHECTNWSKETLALPLFTLEEGKQLLGKRVHVENFANAELYPHNSGRVRLLEMVGQDKFLIMVDWDVDPYEGKESLRFYDKKILRNLIVED